MKKKAMAVILAGAMLMGLLAGCGSDPEQNGDVGSNTGGDVENTQDVIEDETKAEDTSAEEPEIDFEEDPYEVVMEYMYYGNLRPDFQMVEDALSEIAKEKINCTVSLVPVSMFEADTTMSLMISGGEKLDLMISMGATGFQNIVNRGQVIELDELCEQYGADIKETMGIALDGGYLNGKLYGIPSLDKFGREFGFIGVKDYFEKYEMPTMESPSYEELDAWFSRVKEGEGENFYPLILVSSSSNNFGTFEYFHGFDTLGSSIASGVILQDKIDEPTVENLFATDVYAEHCRWMHKWYEAGYINPDCMTTTETAQDIIHAGKGAMYVTYTELDMLPKQQAMFADFNMDKITMVGKYTKQDILNAQNWCVSSNSERPDKAFQFLNLLYKDSDFLNLLYYGIEGVHWEMSERPGFINLLNGADFSNAGWGYNLGLYGAVMKCYQYEDPSYPDDYFEQLTAFDDIHEGDDDVSPYLGYTFNSEAYKTQFAAVNDVITQYRTALEVGAVDPDEVLPQFIESLKAAGIDEIIAGNQEGLDTWLANR